MGDGRLPSYAGVRWPNVWKGIDAVLGERDGKLEWDVVVSKGADAGS
jgi:hypothetical protein